MSDTRYQPPLDPIEAQYEQALRYAQSKGDDNHCLELSIGLNEYRRFYKVRRPPFGGAK